MKAFKSCLVLGFGFLMSLVGYSQNRIETPYFFIQISDTQFGMFTNNREFSKETELYEAAVQKINRLKPDFVIITGDLVNKPSDTLQITEFKRITAQFDNAIPVHFVPGNHDVNLIPDSLSLRFFEENQGPDKFSFEHKGSRFIGINSSIIKAKVPVFEQQQKTWLEQELLTSKHNDHIMIFCHYPFFIHEFNEVESYSNIGIRERAIYLDLFAEFGVDAIFAGHLHDNATGTYKDMQLITTSALGKPLGDAPSGVRIVKVYADKIESRYYGLDQIPEIVLFEK